MGVRGVKLKLALILLVVAFSWLVMFSFHFSELSPHKTFKSPMTLAEIKPTFDRHIKPILDRKCVACHTNTVDRPFFYYIPVADYWSIPYVEGKLEAARSGFDLSNGLTLERLGSTMEQILSLRQAIQKESMPPPAYQNLRAYQKINDSEKEMIISWTEQALLVLNEEVFKENTENTQLPPLTKEAFGDQLAQSLFRASPLARSSDKQAHQKAIEFISGDDFLRTRINAAFLWGGQNKVGNYNTFDQHLNRFNSLVWRKFYLSLFMFEGTYETFQTDEVVAYIFPIQFRGELADGSYPYPFWHSAGKWKKYNEAKSLIFLVKNNKVVAVMRSAAKQDLIPNYTTRIWNGVFRWFDNGVQQPRVNNYATVFSALNPHIDALDKVYRRMALGFRSENCMLCHAPTNEADMKMLEILSSPAHALAAKDRLPIILQANAMPPTVGISDHEVKSTLVELAKEFQKAANRALAYEREPIVDNMAREVIQENKLGASFAMPFVH